MMDERLKAWMDCSVWVSAWYHRCTDGWIEQMNGLEGWMMEGGEEGKKKELSHLVSFLNPTLILTPFQFSYSPKKEKKLFKIEVK